MPGVWPVELHAPGLLCVLGRRSCLPRTAFDPASATQAEIREEIVRLDALELKAILAGNDTTRVMCVQQIRELQAIHFRLCYQRAAS